MKRGVEGRRGRGKGGKTQKEQKVALRGGRLVWVGPEANCWLIVFTSKMILNVM